MIRQRSHYYEEENEVCYSLSFVFSGEEELIVTLYREIRSKKESTRFKGYFPYASSNKGNIHVVCDHPLIKKIGI